MRATIIGDVGDKEHVAHVFNFVLQDDPNSGNQSVEDVQLAANQIRDNWRNFWKHPDVGKCLSPELKYTEVRATYLNAEEADRTPTISGTHRRIVFDYDKPDVLVPTQYAPFAFADSGSLAQGASLPYEVACCVTLKTDLRGPRFRGRSYIGPLSTYVMGTNGMFDANAVNKIGIQLMDSFLAPIVRNTGLAPVVLSRAYATHRPILTTWMGHVPDSQRRRRRSQLEAATLTGNLNTWLQAHPL